MADAGIGLVFDRSSTWLLGVSLGAVFTFLLIFSFCACRQSNEIVIARRCILWARLSVLPIFVCYAIQLNLDLTYYFSPTVLPSVTVIRPAIGLVVCFLSFFINSHAALRWFVVAVHPCFVMASFFTAASTRVFIDCRTAGTCLVQGGISLSELEVYENIQYASAFFSVSHVRILASRPS